MIDKTRVLFRIVGSETLPQDSIGLWCVIPDWSSRTAILLDRDKLPRDIITRNGSRFFGKVYLGVDCADDLYPEDFELPSPRE